VNIDLEGISGQDRKNYTSLLAELREMFKPYGYLLTVSIPAKTADDPQNTRNGAFDYEAIGSQADLVTIMTYDEHWSGGEPGPVASFSWVQSVLEYAVGTIPRQKVLMGVGAYGYDWCSEGTRVVQWDSVNTMTARYGYAQWDDAFCTPYLKYWDWNGISHEVWFENEFSLGLKLDLAEAYGVGGIAVWRLGMEDQSFWDTVRWKLG